MSSSCCCAYDTSLIINININLGLSERYSLIQVEREAIYFFSSRAHVSSVTRSTASLHFASSAAHSLFYSYSSSRTACSGPVYEERCFRRNNFRHLEFDLTLRSNELFLELGVCP